MSKKSWDWKNKMVAAVLNSSSKEELSKIDALVAEHVMGFHNNWDNPGPGGMWGIMDWIEKDGVREPIRAADFPSYTSDIAAAWQVMEKLCESYDVHLQCLANLANGQIWSIYVDGDFESEGPAPLAICLAALRAKGIEV